MKQICRLFPSSELKQNLRDTETEKVRFSLWKTELRSAPGCRHRCSDRAGEQKLPVTAPRRASRDGVTLHAAAL